MIYNMEKIQSPFDREVDAKGNYVVVNRVPEAYKWVFEDPEVRAVEKLHGTNCSLVIENGQIISIWNRTARIPFFNKGKSFIIKGVMESYDRGYCDLPDGQWFGELIGEKVNGNPYNIQGHLWIPFKTYAWEKLHYKSWGKYPKDFNTISEWFKDLMPLFTLRVHGKEYDKHFVEGIVFYGVDGKMSKLRRDMFSWYFEQNPNAKQHKEE